MSHTFQKLIAQLDFDDDEEEEVEVTKSEEITKPIIYKYIHNYRTQFDTAVHERKKRLAIALTTFLQLQGFTHFSVNQYSVTIDIIFTTKPSTPPPSQITLTHFKKSSGFIEDISLISYNTTAEYQFIVYNTDYKFHIEYDFDYNSDYDYDNSSD